jgi:hypothetical protein
VLFRMSQAENAAPNSIAIDGFTGSFVALAPRNDSNGKRHKVLCRAATAHSPRLHLASAERRLWVRSRRKHADLCKTAFILNADVSGAGGEVQLGPEALSQPYEAGPFPKDSGINPDLLGTFAA